MSMTVMEAIEKRRTIRNYDPDYQIPKEIMDKIMKAALLSPTACDLQGEDFLVITNKEKLEKLGQAVLDGMPEGEGKNHFMERKERHGVKNVVTCDASTLVLFIKNERANNDFIRYDAGIASMSIMLAAQQFGIESMCLGIIAGPVMHSNCEKLLGLKDGSIVLGVALGKPLGEIKLKEKTIKCKVTYDA